MERNKNHRIASDPQILHGKPRVRGTRIAVSMVLELVEAGIPFSEIRTKYYPQLTDEDIKACISYARQLIEDAENERLWAEEALRRHEELETGLASERPAEEVFRDARL